MKDQQSRLTCVLYGHPHLFLQRQPQKVQPTDVSCELGFGIIIRLELWVSIQDSNLQAFVHVPFNESSVQIAASNIGACTYGIKK